MCTAAECPATALTEVVAALATQGYFMHADILFMVENTSFGLWAPLLYIISAFSGLIMMALGQPPRMYIWFMVGPGIYAWLTTPTSNAILKPGNPGELRGVGWAIGSVRQDDQGMQNVWNIAEVGLLNTSYYRRFGPEGAGNGTTVVETYSVSSVSANDKPDTRLVVAYPFLWFDELVSDTVSNVVEWLGVGVAPKNPAACSNTHELPTDGSGAAVASWSQLSNSKWPLLENVTAAALHNNDLREAFIVFMASECGDVLKKFINRSVYASAANAHGHDLPTDLFDNQALRADFQDQVIPVPESLASLLKEEPVESDFVKVPQTFTEYLVKGGVIDETQAETLQRGNWRSVSCSAYLNVVVEGFRYEAGNAYYQMVRQAKEKNVSEEQMVYSFLYGWRIPKELGGTAGDPKPDLTDYCSVPEYTIGKQKGFIQSLILMYMFRNELAMAPTPVNPRYTGSEKTIDYTQAYQRNIGSKNKYGELYTWAKMMPYMQGITILLLSMSYPIVCMVVVIPGWYKAVFTWMGFFAWAKSWDIGFAVVMLLEEGIWAMIGNSNNAASINFRVNRLAEKYNLMEVKCNDTLGSGNCYYPEVTPDPTTSNMDYNTEILEEAFLLAPNLDVDLSNSYYIYLMSALYFAVPAVTGQILLGSKAAVSGMVTNAVTPAAQEAGKAAGQGATADVQNHGATAQGVIGQTAYAKNLRSGSGASFLDKALNAGNASLDAQAMSGVHGLGQQDAQNREKMSAQNMAGYNAWSYAAATGLQQIRGRPTESSPASTETSPTTGTLPASLAQVQGYLGPVARGAAGWFQFGAAVGRARQQDAHGENVSAFTRDGFLSSAQGSLAGSQARGHETDARRQQQGAEFAAQSAQWKAMRDWSRQVSGNAAAMGVMAGAFTPGPKPTSIDGMTASGMLDIFAGSGGDVGSNHERAEGGDRSGRFFYAGDTSASGYQARLLGSGMYGQYLESTGNADSPFRLTPAQGGGLRYSYDTNQLGAATRDGFLSPADVVSDIAGITSAIESDDMERFQDLSGEEDE